MWYTDLGTAEGICILFQIPAHIDKLARYVVV
jgi:hypothetical protein